MNNKYPNYIMEYVRQRLGLETNDTSKDHEINEMTANEVFTDICGWKFGYSSWAATIKEWVDDIYGVELK